MQMKTDIMLSHEYSPKYFHFVTLADKKYWAEKILYTLQNLGKKDKLETDL